jgi:hypothetical protein
MFSSREVRLLLFVSSHFRDENRKLLFIMGEGFDFRMPLGLKSFVDNCPEIDVTCILIQFDEGKGSTSRKYKDQVSENLEQLKKLVPQSKIATKKIELWDKEGKRKRRVGDQNAAALFDQATFEGFTDVVVDVSALPRGIYFSLVGKVQTLLDIFFPNINFYILTAENARLDSNITEFQPDAELSYVYGYRGGSELTADRKQVIWLPILGEGKAHQIRAAYDRIKPDEICPVLPFPSKDPRRSDALLIEYHKLLFDELNIEGQNIIYVAEQNPFQVYRTLSQTIRDYNETLDIIKGCDVVISTFSSKLLSLGALLCAHEFKVEGKIKVGILNVDSSGYEVALQEIDEQMISQSELFLAWLAGDPYKL